MNWSRFTRTAGTVAALACAGVAAHAQQDPNLIAYEGFDYTPDFLDLTQVGLLGAPANPGTGWRQTTWVPRQNITGGSNANTAGAPVKTGSLSYPGLVTSGNHVHLTGETLSSEPARSLATTITGEAGTSTYISFLAQRVGEPADPSSIAYDDENTPDVVETYPYGDNLYPRGASVRIYTNKGGYGEALAAGAFSNREVDRWSVYGSGFQPIFTDIPFGASEDVSLIVIRIDHVGGQADPDRVYMWTNPTVGLPENILTADIVIEGLMDGENAIDFSQIEFISPFVGNRSAKVGPDGLPNTADDLILRPHAELLFDELRVGKTYASVVPHDGSTNPEPEPSPVMLRFTDDPNVVEVLAATGESVQLEGSANMVNWTSLESFAGTGEWKQINVSAYASGGNNFFRAVSVGQ